MLPGVEPCINAQTLGSTERLQSEPLSFHSALGKIETFLMEVCMYMLQQHSQLLGDLVWHLCKYTQSKQAGGDVMETT